MSSDFNRGVECAKAFDRFALMADQHYNLGNASNWFLSFRDGYYGVMCRVTGLQQQSASLHEWKAKATLNSHEHDVAVMLFCMDSAIECFVFMLNALGQAVDKSAFRDVSSDKALRRISPDDILGLRTPAMAGYSRFFPTLQLYWKSKAEVMRCIFENHDVTKHRQQAGLNGRCRLDPPAGFYEALGIPDDPFAQAIHGPSPPMEYVSLRKHPKLPFESRSTAPEDWINLEALEKDCTELIMHSFCLALADAQRTIHLKTPTLRP